jgi:HD-GYP domain-containing protein (c-di-GMP phosphodiesterase class II)
MAPDNKSQLHLSEDPQAMGGELARCMQVALRLGRTHGWTNEASLAAVESLLSVINALIAARGQFGMHVAGDFIYLDDVRLRTDGLRHSFLEILVGELNTRGVGSVYFSRTIQADQIQVLLDLLNAQIVGDEETAAFINDQLDAGNIPLAVGPVREMSELIATETEQVTKRERCKKAFFKAVTVTKAVMASAHLGKRLELRHAKRVMQNMVDLMMDEEFTLMGLTTMKTHDSYTFYHSVNVCIYSLALAKRAGFDRVQLADLGVAALFHDLGKTKVPLDILRKTTTFTPEEWDAMRCHPELGVKELVKMRGLSSLAFKSMVASFEHHLNYDPSRPGYPKLRKPYRPHVIGRIVAIADVFDAMTTKRVYSKEAMPRDKALSYMMSQAGTKFDPVLLRLFANMIGVFPVGTVVQLKSGRLGVVIAGPQDPKLCHRPRVRPITDETGITHEFPEIDLSEMNLDGEYPDEIVDTVDPENLGLDISKYFI